MNIEIAQQCSKSLHGIEWLACTRSVVSLVMTLFVIALSVYCIWRMYSVIRRFTFETIPMLTALLQACLQFSLIFFRQSVAVIIIALYMQALTFSLVAYSFTLLYFKLRELDQKTGRRRAKIVLYLYVALWLTIFVFILLTISQTIKVDCEKFLSFDYYIPIAFLFAAALVCSVFGTLLFRRVRDQEKVVLRKTSKAYQLAHDQSNITPEDEAVNQIEMQELQRSPDNFLQLRKQISFIIITFWVTTAMQLIMDEIRERVLKTSDFKCQNNEFQPSDLGGEAYMFVYLLIQLIPCTLVPYGFYYLPSMSTSRIGADAAFQLDQGADDNSFKLKQLNGDEDDDKNQGNNANSSLTESLIDRNQNSPKHDPTQFQHTSKHNGQNTRSDSQQSSNPRKTSVKQRAPRSIAKATLIGNDLDGNLELKPEDFHLQQSPSKISENTNININNNNENSAFQEKNTVNKISQQYQKDSFLNQERESIDVE